MVYNGVISYFIFASDNGLYQRRSVGTATIMAVINYDNKSELVSYETLIVNFYKFCFVNVNLSFVSISKSCVILNSLKIAKICKFVNVLYRH